MDVNLVAQETLDLYRQFGDADYIGEPVSQTEHMSQCAQLALAAGADDEMVLAAFFHDIGHLCEHLMPVELLGGYGVVDHENLGANFLLERGFSQRVAKLVASHVQAKRYLTFTNPAYFSNLSAASLATLQLQGGPMTAEEAADFAADVWHKDYIQMRLWDEQAKLENVPIIDFAVIQQKMIEHLTQSKY